MKQNWQTEHDQAGATMRHTFRNGVRVIVNWRQLTITLERYQRTLDVFPFDDFYTVQAHERLLGEVERITSRSVFYLLKNRDAELRNLRNQMPSIISKETQ